MGTEGREGFCGLRLLETGALLGSLFGFVETILVYGTGTAPWTDGLLLFVLDLGLFMALAWLLSLAGRVSGEGGRVASAGGLALLCLSFALTSLRGSVGSSLVGAPAAFLMRFGLSGLVLACLLGFSTSIRSLAFSRFVLLACLLEMTGGLSLAARRIPAQVMRLDAAQAGALLLWAFGTLVLWMVGRRAERSSPGSPGPAWVAATSLGLTAATSLLWGLPGQPTLGGAAHGPGRAGPSVLLVTLDTVRSDHVSAYGYLRDTTPHLDALARKSLVFPEARAPSPYTLSSHASLLTGLLPSVHGAHCAPFGAPGASLGHGMHDYPLEERWETLAQWFRARGYRTAGLAANYGYLGPSSGLARGFEAYTSRPRRLYRYPPLAVSLLRLLGEGELWPERSWMSADQVTDAAIAWLARDKETSAFLFLNYMDAHSPYRPPVTYLRRFPVTSRSSGRERVVARYDAGIAFADAELGRLLAWLESEGRLDDFAIVVTSDHGEYFGEHGLHFHMQELYEEVLRIPLVVKTPHQRSGLRVPCLAGLQDVAAALRAMSAGIDDPRMAAQSLCGGEARVLAEFWVPPAIHESNPARFASPILRAAYGGSWKLIHREGGRDELFDLRTDPAETRNLLLEDPGLAVGRRLDLLKGLLLPAPAPGPIRAGMIDPEVEEGVRALGYN